MSKKPAHVSETLATQFLRQQRIAFTEHVYDYVDTSVLMVWTPYLREAMVWTVL